MDKDKLEKELASAIMMVMKNHLTTKYNEKGLGEFLQCKIDFKYLHNQGALLVKDLIFKSDVSDYVEP